MKTRTTHVTADADALQSHDREVGCEPAAADSRADGDLAHCVAGDGDENRERRMRGIEGVGGETRHRHRDRVDVGQPDEDRAGDRAGRAGGLSDRATEHDDHAEPIPNETAKREIRSSKSIAGPAAEHGPF